MIVGIPGVAHHRAIRRQQTDIARLAVWAARLRQHIIEALQRKGAALRIPAELCGPREAVNLPGLHPQPLWCTKIGFPTCTESVDKPAALRVPSSPAPER